jgi:hypothetical protein
VKFDLVRDELILDARQAGETLEAIARRFSIGPDRVAKILRRARHTRYHGWRHRDWCLYCERAKWQGSL